MFCGDMALYFSRDDYAQDGTLEPIINIMKDLPSGRLTAGGMAGPAAAFFYCIGFFHITLITDPPYRALSVAAFLLNCFGIIAGGAYHSHCAYLGILGKAAHREALSAVSGYFQKLPPLLYAGELPGLAILLFLIAFGHTDYPRWMALLSPGALFLLRPAARKLPKGLHMVISGGFTNIIFIIYYAAALIYEYVCGLI